MDYIEALHYMYSLADFERSGRFSSRPDVAPVLALLEELGNPHLGRVTVHIAGSKGKGSVAAMVESILRAAGVRTGLFTSPHLHRFPERIQVDAQPVSTDDFAEGLTEVAAAIDRVQQRLPDRPIVTFDALTALGFVLFRKHEAEVQVIEVGLGGLLDSTNVFETKDCAVITNIGLEHRDILGDTIPEIARQKAGIIVAGCPTVMAPQRESAADVIREVATERGSPLTEVALVCNLRRDSASSEAQTFRLRTPRAGYQAKLPLLGKHQLDNAATAVLAVEALAPAGISITEEAVKSGLENVKWPGRIETLKRRPLVIVDAAHTADSARRLRDTLLEYLHVDRATLIIGVMGDKDLEGLAMAIEPAALRVIATQADHPRALSAEAVARVFRDLSIETFVEPKLGAAIDMATSLSTASDAVVILGSIALAGEARAYILGLERDPPV
ncbi:MAG TPA: folylpolyglutamate synthase/dihydrofolate synthase family protein [Dehalococcoidia bacterium]|nr:folylpolyglutamate synthase/dihydrofolate synthase family protein [Dehalococcoidia bacterium]